MNEPKYVNQVCDSIPKLRIEMLEKRGVEIWVDGKCLRNGIRRIEFIADGCKDSPILNISMAVGDFSFEPEKDLVKREQ